SQVVKELGLNDGVTDPRDRVVFHTLRHTFASLLASQGTSLSIIAELMGHRTLAMVKRYSHLLPEAKRQAVAGLERSLTAGSSNSLESSDRA
ncbi:MAG TPA: site-specific integrase, partial [Chloroflexi bacterium]|nr:site-specific integrase [Chloroflexota bacterium]